MCSRYITASSLLFVREQIAQSFKCGKILCNLFSGDSSHSDCQSSNTYLFTQDFTSAEGMSSFEMSPSNVSLAADSATEFPLMPPWPGTQIKTISFPSLVNSTCSSNIFTTIERSYFRLYISCSKYKTDSCFSCLLVYIYLCGILRMIRTTVVARSLHDARFCLA